MLLKLFSASPSFQIYYNIKLQIIQQQKSHIQVQKVQEKVQCWRMFVFIQKNTKSPWNSRTFLLGCKIVAPLWLPQRACAFLDIEPERQTRSKCSSPQTCFARFAPVPRVARSRVKRTFEVSGGKSQKKKADRWSAGLEPERQTRSKSSSLQTCFARFAPVPRVARSRVKRTFEVSGGKSQKKKADRWSAFFFWVTPTISNL